MYEVWGEGGGTHTMGGGGVATRDTEPYMSKWTLVLMSVTLDISIYRTKDAGCPLFVSTWNRDKSGMYNWLMAATAEQEAQLTKPKTS